MRRNLTHAQQERQQTENRRKEDVRQDHVKRLHQEKLFEANMASEERVETKRYIRQMQKEQMEREMLENTTRVGGVRDCDQELLTCHALKYMKNYSLYSMNLLVSIEVQKDKATFTAKGIESNRIKFCVNEMCVHRDDPNLWTKLTALQATLFKIKISYM